MLRTPFVKVVVGPMTRPLDAVVERPVHGAIADFLEWAQSEEACELISEEGLAPQLSDMGGR